MPTEKRTSTTSPAPWGWDMSWEHSGHSCSPLRWHRTQDPYGPPRWDPRVKRCSLKQDCASQRPHMQGTDTMGFAKSASRSAGHHWLWGAVCPRGCEEALLQGRSGARPVPAHVTSAHPRENQLRTLLRRATGQPVPQPELPSMWDVLLPSRGHPTRPHRCHCAVSPPQTLC